MPCSKFIITFNNINLVVVVLVALFAVVSSSPVPTDKELDVSRSSSRKGRFLIGGGFPGSSLSALTSPGADGIGLGYPGGHHGGLGYAGSLLSSCGGPSWIWSVWVRQVANSRNPILEADLVTLSPPPSSPLIKELIDCLYFASVS